MPLRVVSSQTPSSLPIKRGDEVGAFMAAIEVVDRLLTEGYVANNSGNVDWVSRNSEDDVSL